VFFLLLILQIIGQNGTFAICNKSIQSVVWASGLHTHTDFDIRSVFLLRFNCSIPDYPEPLFHDLVSN